MSQRLLKTITAGAVVLATIAAATYYLSTNPGLRGQLAATSPAVVAILILLYLLFMVSLWMVFRSSLVICNAKLDTRETLLVTAYSSIINFFGPLQSGPAFRAIYLKKRHGISVKRYAAASLIYYCYYAFFSALLLLSGVFGWWTILLGSVGLGLGWSLLHYNQRVRRWLGDSSRKGIVQTGVATLVQVTVLVIIFYIELHAIDAAISWRQALVYTGAANFALFVSITPGAIGFRESFVLLTQRLHDIPSSVVVAASLMDRAVYIVMLALLALLIFGTHTQRRLKRITS